MKILINMLAAFCLLLIINYSSTTLIKTSSKSTKIYVNGEYLGQGSASYTDSKIIYSSNTITLRKKGCKAEKHTFRRNEEANIASIIFVFFVIPVFWVMDYKPERYYEVSCD